MALGDCSMESQPDWEETDCAIANAPMGLTVSSSVKLGGFFYTFLFFLFEWSWTWFQNSVATIKMLQMGFFFWLFLQF
jgi:hypothetical protein